MNKTISAILIIIVVIIAGYFLFFRNGGIDYTSDDGGAAVNDALNGNNSNQEEPMSIEDYISTNISSLVGDNADISTEGVSFDVTSVEAVDGTGTAYFDDGTNSYMADFTYSIDENGVISINSFTVYPIIGEKG